MLSVQRQWMTYREPPDRVVFAEPADLQDRLGRMREDAAGKYDATGAGPTGEFPACRKLWPFGSDGHSVGLRMGSPRLSTKWYRNATLFLHHRQTPTRQDRILLLEVGGIINEGPPKLPRHRRLLTFEYMLARPGSLWRDAVAVGGGEWTFPRWTELQGPFKFFAGQPDPHDPTHFTIRYEYEGQPGTIDGYLVDAVPPPGRELIQFVVRDGPAAGQ